MSRLAARPYQTASIDALRAGIRAGHRSQVLCAPTGSGKTYIGTILMEEAASKGNRAAFIVDRIALIDQTSRAFDEFGVAHGVIQAAHWRARPWERIQVCSAQTLARRAFPGELKLIIVDEAHTLYKSTTDFIKSNPGVVVVGLTATPFTQGLKTIYSNVVNVTTTDKLVAEGFLAPIKAYAAKRVDMTGAKVKFDGEYAEADMEARGKAIVGDVVQCWIEKTTEHFHGPAKTLVFSATVAHGEELCRRFQESGFNFQQISYKDGNDDSRRALIEEFRKPDSEIVGLVSCEVLAKGFDVPDVKCIATGQRVLTDKGLVPIEKVTVDHRLWDGIEFVEHQGVIFKGYRDVIEYAGLTATPDHEVHTAQGWRPLGDCAAEQVGITQTGFDERPVRWDAGHFAGDRLAEKGQMGPRARAMRVRSLRSSVRQGFGLASHGAAEAWLPRLLSQAGQGEGGKRPAGLADPSRQKHEISLPEAIARSLRGLWRAWRGVSVPVGPFLRGMGNAEPRLAGAGSQYATGQEGQRRPLRARQPPLGIEGAELQQYAPGRLGRDDAQVPHRASGNPLCGQDAAQSLRNGPELRAGGGSVLSSIGQAKRPVWDILEAGPRNRFTCEGLLVHNCGVSCRPYRKSLSGHIQQVGRVMRPYPGKEFALWLDHAGNYLAFAEDTAIFFAEGVNSLDDNDRDEKVRKPPDKAESDHACKQCKYIMAKADLCCPCCGWVRPRRKSLVEEQPGELVGVDLRRKKVDDWLSDRQAIWRQIVTMAKSGKPPERAEKWALAQYRNLYDEWPARGSFHSAEPLEPTEKLERKIRSLAIRYFKGLEKRKEAAAA